MTASNRDDLDRSIRDLFDSPSEAVERVVEGALARQGPSRVTRKASVVAALVLTGAAAALWLQPPRPAHLSANGEEHIFSVGDLMVLVDQDGTSWVVGPESTSADNDHFNLIIVEEQTP